MKILTVDIGTGTQDIFLYNSDLDVENGFKLVLPSPTMMIHRRVKQALQSRTPILLTGHQMGGGPSAWAIEEAARSGLPVYMTPDAATTLNDELDKVRALGIQIVSEDEVKGLQSKVESLELRDFDFPALAKIFTDYGVSLQDLAAVAVAVFDHGNAPAGMSDRQFRFDYLDERIRARNSLSSFMFPALSIPPIMTRLQAVADSAFNLPCPLLVMDTAPAAVLGATFDPQVAKHEHKLIVNVGNFHTIAFRMLGEHIEGVFEHHTGEIDLPKLENLLYKLADGSLKHQDVFNDMGHGALIYSDEAFEFGREEYDVVVTGPRRAMFRTVHDGPSSTVHGRLRPYFAVPFGDMMIAGCFGLLAATAEVMPDLAEPIHRSMQGEGGSGVAPWDRPA